MARAALQQAPPERAQAAAEMDQAVDYFETVQWPRAPVGPLQAALSSADYQLHHDAAADTGTLSQSYSCLADLSAATRHTISARQAEADRRLKATLGVVVALALGAVVFVIVISVRQYQGIMRPLHRLQGAARRVAAGGFSDRLVIAGDEEFRLLARNFNAMAQELQSLYNGLEERVRSKSRQLIQSDRLASVGYLAAGVAHEINNPLGIIAGYAERAIEKLDRRADEATIAEARKSIQIVCDEAFRCKQITDRLLLLARAGDSARQPVSLARLVREVIVSLGGMPRFLERKMILEAEAGDEFRAIGNEGELRQTILNLVINALEAVLPVNGQVKISLRRAGNEIEMIVSDNGQGMMPHVLSRVFEPFFSEKRGERPGTGLGLSIAQAIVADHRGRIEAHSDGPGAGSRFVVMLPAASEAGYGAGQ
jgi:signal transduction histidine kinase